MPPNRARMLASILPGEATRARPAADVVRCRLVSCAALPHHGIVNNNEITMRELDRGANSPCAARLCALRAASPPAQIAMNSNANNKANNNAAFGRGTRDRFGTRRQGELFGELFGETN